VEHPRPLEEISAALALAEADLADIELALDRIDNGSYGTCEVCGAVLPDEELESSPAARACGDHQP
jgi:DnaK suppressor protein